MTAMLTRRPSPDRELARAVNHNVCGPRPWTRTALAAHLKRVISELNEDLPADSQFGISPDDLIAMHVRQGHLTQNRDYIVPGPNYAKWDTRS